MAPPVSENNAEENRTHVNDLHATLLHLLGIDHEKLTYRFQSRTSVSLMCGN